MRAKGIIGLILALGVLTGASAVQAAQPPDPQQGEFDRTPPRLSFVQGQVSFWRPGAQDWAPGQLNTPLAPGDELYTGSPGNLELQIDARAFVRGWANTQIGLANQEPDFLQFKVTTGHASFDLRTLDPGHTVEVDTPNAAFTIEHPGYYRVVVSGERTSFITRRAGRATLIPASGEAVVITPSEEVVIEGTTSPQVTSYAAPQLDDWDRWNYARTDKLLDAVSARHVSPGTYGVSDLDLYGNWRVVPTYGPVWVPTAVPTGWVPYSTGAWMLDPFYGWTWVDTAPWGWAPYHHGRWVFVNGFWAWAPGPVMMRPVYAPALVAFFGGPSVGVGIGIAGPVVGWVALGWGEPMVPWWGRPGFIHTPWWGGWGGPRVVNNMVVNHATVVTVQNINVYRNASAQNAVVAVHENHFGRGPIMAARVNQVEARHLRPIHAAPQVAARPESFVPTASRGLRPPEGTLRRPVVATRPPHPGPQPAAGGERSAGPAGAPTPAPRLVSPSPARGTAEARPRPPFGQSTVERPMGDRARPPAPPRVEAPRRPEGSLGSTGPASTPAVTRPASPAPRPAPQVATPASPTPPSSVAAPPSVRRPEAPRPPARQLPGEPANRLSPNRTEAGPPQQVERPAPRQPVRPQGEPEKAPRERRGG